MLLLGYCRSSDLLKTQFKERKRTKHLGILGNLDGSFVAEYRKSLSLQNIFFYHTHKKKQNVDVHFVFEGFHDAAKGESNICPTICKAAQGCLRNSCLLLSYRATGRDLSRMRFQNSPSTSPC